MVSHPFLVIVKLSGFIRKVLTIEDFVELWFMGQGYEDHLVTQEIDIPNVDCG